MNDKVAAEAGPWAHSRWAALFDLSSVDVISAAIYVGVLFAHIPRAATMDSPWRTVLSVSLIVLLFAVDRTEALRWSSVSSRVAIALIAARIALMVLVVQLDASTLAWFLLLIPPFRVGLYYGGGVSAVIAGITWVGFGIEHYLTDGGSQALPDIILFAMALVFVCANARAVRDDRQSRNRAETLFNDLRHAHSQLQAQADTVAELARTEERNRLARDIHDSLGHYLTVANVQIAKAIAFQYREPAVSEQAMQNAKELAHDALRAVRQSVGVLRTTPDPFVFEEATRVLVERTGTDECDIELHIAGSEALVGGEALTALYYVTLEGLTNIQKHAHASHVFVDVGFGESEATLTIRDDGDGFSIDARGNDNRGNDSGYGLQSMRERLTSVGGCLTIVSDRSAGTTLTARIPHIPGPARPMSVTLDGGLEL